ncbi:MAG: hypothetical protein ACRES5_05000, partial [Pseudomonas sp.]
CRAGQRIPSWCVDLITKPVKTVEHQHDGVLVCSECPFADLDPRTLSTNTDEPDPGELLPPTSNHSLPESYAPTDFLV